MGGHKIHVCGRFQCHACRRRIPGAVVYCDYCKDDEEDDIDTDHNNKDDLPEVDGHPSWDKKHPREHPLHCPPQLLALTATSRQLYAETRLLPFTSNMFCGHMMDLRIELCKALETWQIEAIRSIGAAAINSSPTGFHEVAKFTGLKQIIVAWSGMGLLGFSSMVDNRLPGYLAETLRGEQEKAQVKVVSRARFVQMDVREEMMAI